MKTILFLLLSLFSSGLHAQENPQLRCRYLLDYIPLLSQPDKIEHDEMVLDIGKKTSLFYSWWNYKAKLYADSLKRSGVEPMQAAMKTAEDMLSGSKKKIYKNLPRTGTLTYICPIVKYFYCEEQITNPEWKLLVEKKEIIGYMCQQAQTNFRGRTWTAWYTTDIPISEGPWKLGGLPGLILEATDKENHYHFYAIALEEPTAPSPIQIPKNKYIKCTYQKLYEMEKESEERSTEFLSKMFNGQIKVYNADGTETKEVSRKYNPIERYKTN